MKNMRDYTVDYSLYCFKAEDEFGDYYKGKYRTGWTDVYGYRCHHYWCTDGKQHTLTEHIAKWEYFNGKIPDGLEVDHYPIPIKNGGTNKLSNLRIGTHGDNMNNPITKKNISKVMKNHPLISKKVHQFSLDGELIKEWSSEQECGRNGFWQWAVSACCNGGYFDKKRGKWVNMKQHKGYIWKHPL